MTSAEVGGGGITAIVMSMLQDLQSDWDTVLNIHGNNLQKQPSRNECHKSGFKFIHDFFQGYYAQTDTHNQTDIHNIHMSIHDAMLTRHP